MESTEQTAPHNQVSESLFKPSAVQQPRIPVWVGVHWPFKRPLQRAARWDGVLPRPWNTGPITPEVLCEITAYIARVAPKCRPRSASSDQRF